MIYHEEEEEMNDDDDWDSQFGKFSPCHNTIIIITLFRCKNVVNYQHLIPRGEVC